MDMNNGKQWNGYKGVEEMNRANHKTQCPTCGIWVTNLRKHRERGRCSMQHIRADKRRFLKMAKKWSDGTFKIKKPESPVMIF